MQDFIQNTDTDAAFLTRIVSTIAFLTKAMPKQMVSIKSCDSAVIFCADYFAELIGIKPEEIIGNKFWSALYDDDMTFANIIAAEDQAEITSREQKAVLKINHFKQGLMPYLCIKTPIINPNTGNVVGLLIQGFEMGAASCLQKIMPALAKADQHSPSSLPHLTKREKQVIFFFLANLSSQAIAEMLYQLEVKRVSKSTIDSIFNDQLYVKFDAYSRPALYKKLQELGYGTKVPKDLLKNTSSLLEVIHMY